MERCMQCWDLSVSLFFFFFFIFHIRVKSYGICILFPFLILLVSFPALSVLFSFQMKKVVQVVLINLFLSQSLLPEVMRHPISDKTPKTIISSGWIVMGARWMEKSLGKTPFNIYLLIIKKKIEIIWMHYLRMKMLIWNLMCQ